MNHHTFTRTAIAVTLLGALLALGACGKKDEAKGTATQVAAKVGSEEISVHQINQVLSRSNNAGGSAEETQAMGRDVLEKLIDQQLAIDQATEAKLHRSPEVVAQIEASKRDILARAYIQQFTSSLPKPTDDEAKKYYAEHPQLFSERRVFNVQELLAKPGPDVAELLRTLSSSSKPLDDMAAALKAKGIPFNSGNSTRPAEQIPLDLLPRMNALKDGQSLVLEVPQGITVLRVVSSQSAPIAEAAALPRIQMFLGNQRAAEAVAAKFKDLRASTKISYLGEFAAPAAATPTAAPATAAAPAPAAAQAPAPAPTDAKSTLEKGVAGLK
jgi:EpsD family peptidyl-prolyl cis-trans isomerase